jgi:hypothetical protein
MFTPVNFFPPSIYFPEFLITNSLKGLVVATLRLPFLYKDYYAALHDAFVELQSLYGLTIFAVSATANVVLRGGADSDRTYSIFYGQDFSKSSDEADEPSSRTSAAGDRDYSITDAVEVASLSDVYRLQTQFQPNSFDQAFFNYFDDSEVQIHQIVNIVYIMKGTLMNMSLQGRLATKGRFVPVPNFGGRGEKSTVDFPLPRALKSLKRSRKAR